MHAIFSRNITPMLQTKINILKWILILLFTRTNGFMVLKLRNINEDQLVTNILNILKTTNNKIEPHYLNNIVVRSPSIRRRVIHPKEFKNKILVKRIVPHGYQASIFEYDEKFQTLYKPLVRLHKIAPSDLDKEVSENENRFDLILIVNDPKNENRFQSKFFDKDEVSGKADVQEYTGGDAENSLLDFITNNDEKSLIGNDLIANNAENFDRLPLSFGPMGILKAKQLRKIKKRRPDNRNKKILRDVDEPNDNFKWNAPQVIDLRPQQKFYKENKTDEKFIEHIIGIFTNQIDTVRASHNPVPSRDELITQIVHSIRKHRHNSDDDHTYEYLYRNEKFGEDDKSTIRDNYKDPKDNLLMKWFGSEGHKIGKQTKRQKRKRVNMPSKNSIETKLFGPIGAYKLNRKEKQRLKSTELNVEGSNDELRTLYKSNEEADPFTPPKLYFDDDEVTTKKPKKWLPQYPFWNYWTYDKTLYQDQCQGNLVKVGELCLAPPAST